MSRHLPRACSVLPVPMPHCWLGLPVQVASWIGVPLVVADPGTSTHSVEDRNDTIGPTAGPGVVAGGWGRAVIENFEKVALTGVAEPALDTSMPALDIRENQETTSVGVLTAPTWTRLPPLRL